MDDPQNLTAGPDIVAPLIDVDSVGTDEDDEALSLKAARFLRLCWMRRRLVGGILASGILISLLCAYLEPSVYTSTTTLMPPNSASSYSNLMSLLTTSSSAASLGSEALGLSTPGELFVSILESRNVVDSLITRYDLMRYYDAQILEDARKPLESDTKVAQDRKSGIITISVTVRDPVLASKIAQGYVEELNRVVTGNSTSSARSERIFLEGRLSDVKKQLDDSAKALSAFSTKSGAIDMPSQAKSMIESGVKLQADLIEGRSQLAALRQTYSEDNPRVRAIEARNAELQRQMDEIARRPQGSGSKSDTGISPYPSAGELPTLGLTYYDLERKMRVEEALWEALTKQYESAKIEEAGQTPTVRVLDPANIPQRKSGPSRRLILLVGMSLSFLVAAISVFAETFWEEMDPEEEPKKLIEEIAGAALERRRWYWSLPGMSRIYSRLRGSGDLS